MTAEPTTCPHCGFRAETPGEVFCGNCGKELRQAGPAEHAARDDTTITPADQTKDFAGGAGGADPVESAPPPADSPPTPPLEFIRNAENAGCDGALDVLYNSARIFVEGATVPFEFRITPRRADISDLCVEVRHSHRLIDRYEPEYELIQGQEMPIYLQFCAPPGLHGKVPFDIYVGFKLGGAQSWYLAKQLHTVFKRKEKIGHVIETLKVEFHNELHQGHAGDAQVHQRLDGLDALRPRYEDTAADFEHIDIAPVWTGLPLMKCHYHPPSGESGIVVYPPLPPANAIRNRLTLQTGSMRIHLLADTLLQLGRNSLCAIVTRGSARDAEISRFHCRIQTDSKRCWITDAAADPGGAPRPSTAGTYIDGVRLFPGQSRDLAPGGRLTLSLAGNHQVGSGAFILEARLYNSGTVPGATACPRTCVATGIPDAPAALLLRRPGPDQECFVAVWQWFSLGELCPEMGNACVCRRSGAFLMHTGTNCNWLAPGENFNVAGQAFAVTDYCQDGLTKNRRNA